MMQLRWYDKDLRLKSLFELIQGMDNSIQNEVAKDIIQILLNDLRIDLDVNLNLIGKDTPLVYKRWYDRNVDLYSCFEIIRNLPKNLKDEVINKVSESVLLMYIGEQVNE